MSNEYIKLLFKEFHRNFMIIRSMCKCVCGCIYTYSYCTNVLFTKKNGVWSMPIHETSRGFLLSKIRSHSNDFRIFVCNFHYSQTHNIQTKFKYSHQNQIYQIKSVFVLDVNKVLRNHWTTWDELQLKKPLGFSGSFGLQQFWFDNAVDHSEQSLGSSKVHFQNTYNFFYIQTDDIQRQSRYVHQNECTLSYLRETAYIITSNYSQKPPSTNITLLHYAYVNYIANKSNII